MRVLSCVRARSAGTLIERSAFHITAGGPGPALDDFREVLSHLGEAP
ncbi:hypothetical protein ACUN3E_19195 [Streptomyces sp. Ju416(a)]|nr:hypothetical protein [Streptomyces sp. CS014]